MLGSDLGVEPIIGNRPIYYMWGKSEGSMEPLFWGWACIKKFIWSGAPRSYMQSQHACL